MDVLSGSPLQPDRGLAQRVLLPASPGAAQCAHHLLTGRPRGEQDVQPVPAVCYSCSVLYCNQFCYDIVDEREMNLQ